MLSKNPRFNALSHALFIAMRHEDGNALPALRQAEEFVKMETEGNTLGMNSMILVMELKLNTYKHASVSLYNYFRFNSGKAASADKDHFELLRGIEYALREAVFGNFTHLCQMANEVAQLQRKVPA